ncbi:hypothetical protein ACH4PW_23500 [Streptomyces sp. NPDC017082]|uniref:hypothetical protein n=1 Tax=Streptomyces sp. NPDC017082 TaxID=3364974 RepID=UPI0037960806
MGRRGGPRPGARFLVPASVLPALLFAAGCADPGASPHPAYPTHSATTPHPAPSASAPPVSDAALCTRLVTYWAREVLDGETYGDYQSMGLSHGQYDILRDAVDAGRAAGKRQAAGDVTELTARQIRAECAARYRHGRPDDAPWT